MCGITGIASFSRIPNNGVEKVRMMMLAMEHRGPDADGLGDFDNVILGHKRLSIIDLSENGQQPIYNEDKSIAIVYNGELYNFPELKKELLTKGHQFRTNTDTEVLVHLYEEEGIDFLKRLNGMFAFALYDMNKKELVVARDRFGVKPFIYSYDGDTLTFASELQALKTLPDFNYEKDLEAMSIFLSLYFIPDPWTGYKNVKRLEAGHYMVLSEKGLRTGQYYDLDFGTKDSRITRNEAEKEIARLFDQSVGRQLIADVPVAVALSGGLDSRTILASAINRNPNTQSFTITFNEELFNEGTVASYWANLYKSPHHTMHYKEQDFCSTIIDRQRRIGEPYGFLGDVALESLAFFIKSHGIKVVLGGIGGDELFAGYPTLHAANLARYYRFLPKSLREKLISPLIMRLPAGKSKVPLSFKLKSFVAADHDDPYRNFFKFKEVLRREDMPQILTEEGWSKLAKHDPFACYEQYTDKVKDWELIDALTYFDFKVFMGGNLFSTADSEFMAASVEQRVPFMDNDLIDFVQRLPVSVRFHPYKLKHILRNSFQKHFPVPENDSSGKGYKKLGFDIPINNWIKDGCFSDLTDKVLSKRRLERIGMFEHKSIERLLKEQRSGKQNNERVLQNIISTVLFMDDCYNEL